MSTSAEPGQGPAPVPPQGYTPGPLNISAPRMLAAMKHSAIAAGVGLVVALIAGSIAQSQVPSWASGVTGDSFKNSLNLFLVAFRAPLTFTGGASVGASADASVTLFLPLLAFIPLALLFWLARADEHRSPSPDLRQLLGPIGYAGGVAAVVGLLVALIGKQSMGTQAQVSWLPVSADASVGVQPVLAMLVLFVFFAGAAAAGRLTVASSRELLLARSGAGRQWLAKALLPGRAVGEFLLLVSAVVTVVGLLLVLKEVGFEVAALAVLLVGLPVYPVAAAFIMLGMPITAGGSSATESILSSSSSRSSSSTVTGVIWSGIPLWAVLLTIVVAVACVAVAAVRHGARRGPSAQIPWAEAAIGGGVLAALSLFVDLLTSVSASYDLGAVIAGADASVSASLSFLPGALVPFAWGFLVVLAAHWAAPLYLQRFGTTLFLVRSVNPAWTGEQPPAPAPASPVPAEQGEAAPTVVLDKATTADPASAPLVPPAAPAPAPVILPAGPREPMSKRTKLIIAGVAGASVLVLAGVVAVNALSSSLFSPTKQVEGYYAALASGNAQAALAYSSTEVSGPLLTDAVLAQENTLGGVTAVTIGEPQISGDEAYVPASYTIGGQEFNDSVRLVKDGNTLLFFPNWRLASVTAPLAVGVYDQTGGSDDASTIKVNGVEVDGTGTLLVFPGTVQVDSTDPMFDYEGNILTIPYLSGSGYGGQDGSSVTRTLSSEYLSKIDPALEAAVTQCMASTETAPGGCPNGFDALTDATDVSWSLLTPVVSQGVEQVNDRTVIVTVTGQFEMKYVSQDYSYFGSCTSRQGPYSFEGPFDCTDSDSVSRAAITFDDSGNVTGIVWDPPY